MKLATLRDELQRELATDRTQQLFDQAKLGQSTLSRYSTVFSVLAVLEDQQLAGYEAQDALLRALVALAQEHPEQRLWRQILLHAFLPGLISIRRRTIQGDHEPAELDACLWTAFLEVLHRYPLHRKGSIAAGLLLDTRKSYFRSLVLEQEIRKQERALIAYARQVSDNDAEQFAPADHAEPSPLTVEPDEREEMRLMLQSCSGLSAEDIDLLLAVDVDSLTIPVYMQRQGIATGNKELDARERDRLARRRLRARERLQHGLRQKSRR